MNNEDFLERRLLSSDLMNVMNTFLGHPDIVVDVCSGQAKAGSKDCPTLSNKKKQLRAVTAFISAPPLGLEPRTL